MVKFKITAYFLSALIVFLTILSTTQLFPERFYQLVKMALYSAFIVASFYLFVKGRIHVSIVSILLLLWFFLFFITGVFSENLLHGLWTTINTAVVTLLFFLLVSQLSVNQLNQLSHNVWMSILCIIVIPSMVVFILPIGVMQLIASQSFMEAHTTMLLKYKGVFLNQNSFSICLSVYLALSVYFGAQNKLGFFGYLFSMVAVIFLISTLSRAGIGMFSVFLLSYILFTLNSKRTIYLLGAIFMIGTLSFLIIDYGFLGERFSGGLSSRDVIWADAISRWLEEPYLGLGPNQYVYTYIKGDEMYTLSTHNEYLSILVNQGIVMLSLFLFLLAVVLYRLLRISLYSFNNRKIIGALFAFCIALLFHQFFETRGFHPRQISGLMFILILVFLNKVSKRVYV